MTLIHAIRTILTLGASWQCLRDYYINDRVPVNPEFSTPTEPGISKLLFYCKLKRLPKTPKDALAAFKQITTQTQSTLAAQAEYVHWLANRKSVHDRREFSESYFGGRPDLIRAGALLSTLGLLETAWGSLLSAAVENNHPPARLPAHFSRTGKYFS